jgi:hypothetical protein
LVHWTPVPDTKWPRRGYAQLAERPATCIGGGTNVAGRYETEVLGLRVVVRPLEKEVEGTGFSVAAAIRKEVALRIVDLDGRPRRLMADEVCQERFQERLVFAGVPEGPAKPPPRDHSDGRCADEVEGHRSAV